jgi:hypothetical protein
MRRAAILLGLLALAAGCGADGEAGCTLIGCGPPSAVVELSGLPNEKTAVRICADGVCRTFRGRGLTVGAVRLPKGDADHTAVTVEVRSGRRLLLRRSADIPVTEFRPNGPRCEPRCRSARARLDMRGGRLESA